MRCGCPSCGVLMIHEESGAHLDCCCPSCGYRCSACLGTDSVLSREDLQAIRQGAFLPRAAQIERDLEEALADASDDGDEGHAEDQWTKTYWKD